ncbi:MCP four helix bundle domain-containing protein, partial [Pelomonas sp. KK5]|uniref:MCP four helix bundle domain-containing protein n=1 Tax=Pelomonas sp. KK5 TaxID=1855730 RepID=UPI00117E40E7
MPSLKNLTIAAKLYAAFAFMLVLLIGVALFAWTRLRTVQDDSHTISTNWLPAVSAAHAMETDLANYRIGLLQMVTSRNPDKTKAAEDAMTAAGQAFKGHATAYEKLVSSERERELYQRFSTAWKSYYTHTLTIAGHMRDSNYDDAVRLQNGDARKAYEESSRLAAELVALNERGAGESAANADDTYASAVRLLLLVAVLAAVAAAVMAVTLVRAVTRPLARAVRA